MSPDCVSSVFHNHLRCLRVSFYYQQVKGDDCYSLKDFRAILVNINCKYLSCCELHTITSILKISVNHVFMTHIQNIVFVLECGCLNCQLPKNCSVLFLKTVLNIYCVPISICLQTTCKVSTYRVF